MTLSEQIQNDLKASMKARDGDTTATLRMVLAGIKNLRVAEGRAGEEVSDTEVLQLLTREAKKRAEAAEAYARAGREELAAKERRELAVIRRYLPEQLSEDELEAIVDQAVVEANATGPGDLGKVMSVVMPKVQGRADGKRVSTAVRARLCSS